MASKLTKAQSAELWMSDETLRDDLLSRQIYNAEHGMVAVVRVENQSGYYGDRYANLFVAAPIMSNVLHRLIKWDTDFPVNSSNGYAGLKELNAIIADAKNAMGDDEL